MSYARKLEIICLCSWVYIRNTIFRLQNELFVENLWLQIYPVHSRMLYKLLGQAYVKKYKYANDRLYFR